MRFPSIAFYPPLPPGAHLRRPAKQLPYPLGREDCTLFSRGRHAIWQAARALGLGPGDRVLAPAWHHGAEIEALQQRGAAIGFYEPGASLEPDADELEALIDPRTRALFITHFLGFPQDAARWRAWCDSRGLLLIEDGAHACLAGPEHAPVGSHGQAAVWCLFKSFAVPDGAALRLAGGSASPDGAAPLGATEMARSHAHWVFQHTHPHTLPGFADRSDGGGHFDLAAEVALGRPGTPPSAATTFLLPRVADLRAGARRRANYLLLLEELGDQVPEPFDRLPEHAVPLGLPLRSDDKRALLARLGERGIDAVDFWCAPHPLLPARGFELSARRRASTVLLPVHQELGPAELDQMMDAARRRPRAPLLHAERVRSVAEIHEEWSELALRARNIFATPEWATVWCAHFLHGRTLELITLRDTAGRLVAVLPMYALAEKPLRVVRMLGHGPGEDLGPVCDPVDRVRVARALPHVLANSGAHALLADQVSGRTGWSGLTGARVLRTEGSPVARFGPGGWDAFIAARSRRLRKELRRNERILATQHSLRIRLAGPDEIDRDLETMFALHDARWRVGASRFTAQRAFHRDFAAVARERGWLRVWTLEADGRPRAAAYGFRYAGVEFDYQGGRDPDWQGPSTGLVLQGHQMHAASEDGISEYRLCRGDAWYKRRFATDDPGLETLVVARGPAAAAVAAAGAALPEPLSKIVKRRLAA